MKRSVHLLPYLKRISVLLIIVVIIVASRICLADAYYVRSASMERTLLVGDLILVNKFRTGARLPMSVGDVPFLEPLLYMSGLLHQTQDWQAPYRRLPATSKIKRGDILIFERASGKGKMVVKRCIGMPGDTLAIARTGVTINGRLQVAAPTTMYTFRVAHHGRKLSEIPSLASKGVTASDLIWKDERYSHFSATMGVIEELRCTANSVPVKILDRPASGPSTLFPHGSGYTAENYGPVVVPARGRSVMLSDANIEAYRQVITEYERNRLEQREGQFWINGQRTDHYRFKMDYYFVMGDNRGNSFDSRYWGFLPEQEIVGTTRFVLCSFGKQDKSESGPRWSRFFKKIN